MYPEQLQCRRAEILALAGMSEPELRERADEYTLPTELVVLVDELNQIDFLLGE